MRVVTELSFNTDLQKKQVWFGLGVLDFADAKCIADHPPWASQSVTGYRHSLDCALFAARWDTYMLQMILHCSSY